MAWIESHQSLLNHPKTIAAAELLGSDRVKLIGHLHVLWWWALDIVDYDGYFPPRCTAAVIARGSLWKGKPQPYVDALVDSGFIDLEDNGRLKMHDWYEYAGKYNAKKLANKQRMRDARAEHVQTHDSIRAEPPTLPTSPHLPNKPDQPTGLTVLPVRTGAASSPYNLSPSEWTEVYGKFPGEARLHEFFREWSEWNEKSGKSPSALDNKVGAFIGFVKQKTAAAAAR